MKIVALVVLIAFAQAANYMSLDGYGRWQRFLATGQWQAR